MKEELKILVVVAAGMLTGAGIMHRCTAPPVGADGAGAVPDTTRVVRYDTVTVLEPVAKGERIVGTVERRLRRVVVKAVNPKEESDQTSTIGPEQKEMDLKVLHRTSHEGEGAGGKPRQRAMMDGPDAGCETRGGISNDSIEVEIPVTQRHYVDSTYDAWVSGYEPRLDSIRVYARNETRTVRIREPPRRWHVSVTAGYGYTPKGFQPWIGIGISYSIFSWK